MTGTPQSSGLWWPTGLNEFHVGICHYAEFAVRVAQQTRMFRGHAKFLGVHPASIQLGHPCAMRCKRHACGQQFCDRFSNHMQTLPKWQRLRRSTVHASPKIQACQKRGHRCKVVAMYVILEPHLSLGMTMQEQLRISSHPDKEEGPDKAVALRRKCFDDLKCRRAFYMQVKQPDPALRQGRALRHSAKIWAQVLSAHCPNGQCLNRPGQQRHGDDYRFPLA